MSFIELWMSSSFFNNKLTYVHCFVIYPQTTSTWSTWMVCHIWLFGFPVAMNSASSPWNQSPTTLATCWPCSKLRIAASIELRWSTGTECESLHPAPSTACWMTPLGCLSISVSQVIIKLIHLQLQHTNQQSHTGGYSTETWEDHSGISGQSGRCAQGYCSGEV